MKRLSPALLPDMGKAIDTYEQILTFLGLEQNITDAEFEEISEEDDEIHD